VKRAALLALLLCSGASIALGQAKVWRCTDAQGRTVYQDSACAAATDARPVQAADPVDAATVTEAQRRAKAEQALGERMTRERQDAERRAAQQRPIQLAGPTAAAAGSASAAAPPSRKRSEDRPQKNPPVSPAPAFKPPGSLQKAGPAAP
jgi:hypothetical protein